MELLLEPQGHRVEKRLETARRVGEIGLEQAAIGEYGLVVEAHIVELLRIEFRLAQTVVDGVARERRVVLLPGKTLFLSCCDDLTIDDECGGRIVIERRDAQNRGFQLIALDRE